MSWCTSALTSKSDGSFGNARTSEDSLPKEILARRTSRHPPMAAECSQNELGFGVYGLLPGESDGPNRQNIGLLSFWLDGRAETGLLFEYPALTQPTFTVLQGLLLQFYNYERFKLGGVLFLQG